MYRFGDIFTYDSVLRTQPETHINPVNYYYNCVLLMKIDDCDGGHKIDTVIFNEVKLTLDFFDGETVFTKKLGIIGYPKQK